MTIFRYNGNGLLYTIYHGSTKMGRYLPKNVVFKGNMSINNFISVA